MTDRVYPSAKPAPPPGSIAAGGNANPAFPATKAQLYSNARPAYRPQARHRRGGRCCSCCLWTTVAILVVILLVGLAGVAFYLIYRPQRPSFSVTSLKLSYLNLSSSSQLSSRFDVSLTARNPNKNLVYLYSPISIKVLSGAGVSLAEGAIPAFSHPKRNTTALKSQISSSKRTLEKPEATGLRTSMRSKAGVPIQVRMETKVRAKVGSLKTPRIGVRVSCNGIRATVPTGKTPATASTANAKCKVDIRVKIWKWTI